MRSSIDKEFDEIVGEYRRYMKENPDQHLAYCKGCCKKQTNLADVIEIAAKAIDGQNKIHRHQTRIGKIKLNLFAEKLKEKEPEIKQAKNFDELLSIVESVRCDGIAELTHYDTAERIGAYLDRYPDKIYLHAGTRVGVRNLLGDSIKNRKYITLDELPKEFLRHDLTASEFENIFCNCKDDFIDILKAI